MNTYAKCSTKYQEIKSKKLIKLILHYDKVSNSGSSIKNDVLLHQQAGEQKAYDHINCFRKSISQNSIAIPNKNSQQTKNNEELLQLV